MKTIFPLKNHVIVKPLQKDKTTKSGIIIPDFISDEKSQEGEVTAVGVGRLDGNGNRIRMDVKIGDKVVFSQYVLDEVEVDGEKHFIIAEEDIKAIFV